MERGTSQCNHFHSETVLISVSVKSRKSHRHKCPLLQQQSHENQQKREREREREREMDESFSIIGHRNWTYAVHLRDDCTTTAPQVHPHDQLAMALIHNGISGVHLPLNKPGNRKRTWFFQFPGQNLGELVLNCHEGEVKMLHFAPDCHTVTISPTVLLLWIRANPTPIIYRQKKCSNKKDGLLHILSSDSGQTGRTGRGEHNYAHTAQTHQVPVDKLMSLEELHCAGNLDNHVHQHTRSALKFFVLPEVIKKATCN